MKNLKSNCSNVSRGDAGTQRRALLAKVHIAKKNLCLPDDEYRSILERFGKESAGKLTVAQLEELVKYFIFLGWKSAPNAQIAALQERVTEFIAGMKNGNARMTPLIKRVCGADRIEWCRDTAKLKRLLTILKKINEIDKNEAS